MNYAVKNLLIEPYRFFFLGGSLNAVFSLAIWFFHWHSLWKGSASLVLSYSPGLFHLLGLLFGSLGFYVMGFLLTAFPKWMNGNPFEKTSCLSLFTFQALSQIFGMLGFFGSDFYLKIAFALALFSHFFLLLLLFKKYLKTPENTYAFFVFFPLLAAIASLSLALLYAFKIENYHYYGISILLAGQLYLLPLILAITSRIIPFFSSKVLPGFKIKSSKNFLILTFSLLGIFTLLEAPLFQNWKAVKIILTLLLFCLLSDHFCSWKPWQTLKIPLLLVLHISWTWIPVYFILHLFQNLFFPQNFSLKISILHALFVGLDLSLIVAISTRVIRGHGGYPLELDWPAGLAFILLQGSAVIRILLPFLAIYKAGFAQYTYYSIILALIAFLIWGFRYWPLLFSSK